MAGRKTVKELPDADKLEMASRLRREIDKEDIRHEKDRDRLVDQLNRVVANCFDGIRRPIIKKRKYVRKGKKLAPAKGLTPGANGKGHRLFDDAGAPVTTIGCALLILKNKGEAMHMSNLAAEVKVMAKSLRIKIRAKNAKTFVQSLSTQLYKKADLFEKTGRSMFKASDKVELPKAA